MKRTHYFTLIPFLFINCALFEKKKFSDDIFAQIWNPELTLLTTAPTRELPFLNIDLLQQHHNEISLIANKWKQALKTGTNNIELRKEENEFYFNQIMTLNSNTFREAILAPSEQSYKEQAHKVLNNIVQHPTSSHHYIRSYHSGDQIGFCFGRALMIHYALLQHGVPQNDIRKIFAIGDLMVNGQIWDYHMAVMVKDPEMGFLVIDPIQPTVMRYEEWVKDLQEYSIKKPYSRIRFFITDPRKFSPSSGAYSLTNLSEPIVKQYFWDIGTSIRTWAQIKTK